jgi:Ser/Thr protein kinase RdoA (MazF antagonist)
MISCVRSVPTTAAVAELVGRWYGVDVADCVLLRSLVNDVYEVSAGDRQRYVLKVYQHGGWSTEEVEWEQELVAHAAASGSAVAEPVPLVDGRLAGEVIAAEGDRPFALSVFVEGRKPLSPWTDGLYRDFGALIAGFHRASDTFRSNRARRPFDLQTTLEEPLQQVLPRLADRPTDQRLVAEFGGHARQQLADLAEHGLTWGVRHGDATMDNVHLTESGMVLHDFDRASMGWRAADLTGVFTGPRSSLHWDAFLAGYTAIADLTPVDLRALPWLAGAELISNLAYLLVENPSFRGTEAMDDSIVERELNGLRDLSIREVC